MSEAELKAFISERGLTARPGKDNSETGQQFISFSKDYSIKITNQSYKDKVQSRKPDPLKSYQYLVRIDFVEESLEYMITHGQMRVGSGDRKTQAFFESELTLQGPVEKGGVMVAKLEPVKNSSPALNIGLTPKTEQSDPRRELNKFIMGAVLLGEFKADLG
jgi:hypothetical protein